MSTDFEFKVKHARNFLGEGAKVRAYVQFRVLKYRLSGSWRIAPLKFMKVEEFGTAEAITQIRRFQMGVLISPKKENNCKKAPNRSILLELFYVRTEKDNQTSWTSTLLTPIDIVIVQLYQKCWTDISILFK